MFVKHPYPARQSQQHQATQAQAEIARLQQASSQDQSTVRGLRQQLEQCKEQLTLKARTIEEVREACRSAQLLP
jgi:uncharacterized coiled-coil DUF342 family protein